MKIKLDRSANAAYISLIGEIGFGQITKQYHCDIKKVSGIINLDFDSEGRLLGSEVMDASHLLSSETLEGAEIIG